MKTPKISFGCCVDDMNEKIYTVGGLRGTEDCIAECTSYDIEQNKWTTLPSLHEPCYSASCIVFNSDCLYTIGGINNSGKEMKTF